MIQFTVIGKAEPAGSKRAFVRGGHAQVVDANPKSRSWKNQVAEFAASLSLGELLEGPLAVEFSFYTPRPKSHYGTGRNANVLKPSSPASPITRPDVLKLARAVEDALQGVLYRDDAQIVDEVLRKFYGSPARVEIKVAPVPFATAADTEGLAA